MDLSQVTATADSTVSGLLSLYTARTDDGDQSICDTCGVNVDTDTKIRIIQYPKILLICHIPQHQPHKITFDTLITNTEMDYSLRSFVSHHGNTINSGHYTSTVSFGGNFVEYSDAYIAVKDTAVSSSECYLLAYQATAQDNSLFLAEFQWLKSKRLNDKAQLEVKEVIKGMERLSSNEVVTSQNNQIVEEVCNYSLQKQLLTLSQ